MERLVVVVVVDQSSSIQQVVQGNPEQRIAEKTDREGRNQAGLTH
jgi:hypothetical protein